MTGVIPFEKHRFQAAAQHYLQGRPAYAPRLIRRLAELCGLGPHSRVMDLGCGPGQLALAIAPLVGGVVGIDPEPAMLAVAAERASAAGLAIRLLEGSSEDIGPQHGRFDLVMIGRAFHWMDRSATLRRLDEIVEPSGAVALLHTRDPALPENAWLKVYEALIDRYAEGDAARRQRKGPDWVPADAILLDSPFGRIERIAVLERRRTTVESVVARALSLSSTSATRIGERTRELAADLRAALAPFALEGELRQVVESEATVAWRPARGSEEAGGS